LSLQIKVFYCKKGSAKGSSTSISKRGLDSEITQIYQKNVNQVYSIVAYEAPELNEKDIYSLDVIDELLSGGESSVLNKKLKMRWAW